jgi:hypothetical protein
VIGGFSAAAAFTEFKSLQIQIESAQNRVDPWLEMRQTVVGGQIATFGTQALLGFGYTARALAGSITVDVAILRYTLYMGPLNWLILILGVLHLITSLLQKTPLQNFLNNCCWSKARANDLQPIPPKAQQDELDRLYFILYAPRVSMESNLKSNHGNGPSRLEYYSSINHLTLDLPGAEPDSVYLELSMVGDPLDSLNYREQIKPAGAIISSHCVLARPDTALAGQQRLPVDTVQGRAGPAPQRPVQHTEQCPELPTRHGFPACALSHAIDRHARRPTLHRRRARAGLYPESLNGRDRPVGGPDA